MAYDDDMGHDEDQGIGNDPGGGGDEPQVDTFSEFSQPPGTTPGFDAGRGDFSVGSQKGNQTTKGNPFFDCGAAYPNVRNYGGKAISPVDFATSAYSAKAGLGLGKAGKDALAARAADIALRGAGQQTVYDTPLEYGWDKPGSKVAGAFGITSKKDTDAAKEEQKYGEFSQTQFNASINNIENLTANRSSLPPEIAYDIATNPLSRRSSGGEKALAGLQLVAPYGTLVGLVRTAAMSRGFGGKQTVGKHVFDEGDFYKLPKSNTTPQSNRTNLGITDPNQNRTTPSGPTRAMMRRAAYGRARGYR